MFNQILVALSEHELDNVLDRPIYQVLKSLNLDSTTRLILGHVVPVNAEQLERGLDQHHESEALLQNKAAEARAALQTHLNCPTTLEVVSGEPGEEIVRLANIHHANLIVLGSRGLKGVSRVLNLSVSSQVSEEAPCSVLVVKSES